MLQYVGNVDTGTKHRHVCTVGQRTSSSELDRHGSDVFGGENKRLCALTPQRSMYSSKSSLLANSSNFSSSVVLHEFSAEDLQASSSASSRTKRSGW